MPHILFAWELGTGYGHVMRMAMLARRLAASGHTIAAIVQDPAATARAFAGITTDIHRAPPTPDVIEQHYADSFAEILLRCGFADPTALTARLRAWRAIFAAQRPTLVIADFAPHATLAARSSGLPVATVETGYTIPPLRTPLPFMRPWEPPSPRLDALDSTALAHVNTSLTALGAPPLPALHAMFDATRSFICNFPELDHYPDRGDADHYGPLYQESEGTTPEWPALPGPRVFAYLSAGHPAAGSVIAALEARRLPTVMHIRGTPPPGAQSAVRLYAQPLRLSAALAGCDIVICQGLNTLSAALLAARPVLLMPEYLEQMMILHRVAQQGLGVGIGRDAGASAVIAALATLTTDPAFARRARAFADRYHGYHPGLALDGIESDIVAFLETYDPVH